MIKVVAAILGYALVAGPAVARAPAAPPRAS